MIALGVVVLVSAVFARAMNVTLQTIGPSAYWYLTRSTGWVAPGARTVTGTVVASAL
jgi:hypothetical protein